MCIDKRKHGNKQGPWPPEKHSNHQSLASLQGWTERNECRPPHPGAAADHPPAHPASPPPKRRALPPRREAPPPPAAAAVGLLLLAADGAVAALRGLCSAHHKLLEEGCEEPLAGDLCRQRSLAGAQHLHCMTPRTRLPSSGAR